MILQMFSLSALELGFVILIILSVLLIIAVPIIMSLWKLYQIAGHPGWACIVPIYSTIVKLEIIKKPWWWLLLMMIPYLNLIWIIWSTNLFVKAFGKNEGYTIGCLLLPFIFYPILAFDKNTKYIHSENIDEINEIGAVTKY
jgi:hypothetical protein